MHGLDPRFHDALPLKVHGLAIPAMTNERRNLTIPSLQKTMGSSWGGIDVDFRF
jgi:hypothetical protein